MTLDEIAIELMQLYTHLRANADPQIRTVIEQRIDELLRTADALAIEEATAPAGRPDRGKTRQVRPRLH